MEYNSWTLPARTRSMAQSTTWSTGGSNDEQIFYSLGPVNGLLTGAQVRPTLQKSGLPTEKLAQIWEQVDRDKDGKVNLHEFLTAMALIRQAKFSFAKPDVSPMSGLTLAKGGTSLQPNPAISLGTSSLFGSGAVGKGNSPSLGSGGVGRGVSLTSLQMPSTITSDARRRYNLIFNNYDKSRSGHLSGEDARKALTSSDLDKDTLRKIWELADVDKDGRLSSDEFAIAMHLIERAQKGIAPPTSLPPGLLSKDVPPLSPGVRSVSNFEDKKKENFDLGRAELERRRRALLEEEKKIKEEKEQKRRAEEERQRQEMLRIEAFKQAELEKQRQKALEIERAREKALQQAALQREAEARETERKRKEEWAKRRKAEIEAEKNKEMETMLSLKHYHQELLEQLTKTELEKRTTKLRADQQRTYCVELAQSLDPLKQSYSSQHSQLLTLTAGITSYRQELARLESERKDLQQRLSQKMTSEGGQEVLKLMDQCRILSGNLTSLKVSLTQHISQYEQLKNTVKEKKIRLTNLQAETFKTAETNKRLQLRKEQLLKIKQELERQKEIQRQQQEQEKKKAIEADRRMKAIEQARIEQQAMEEEIKRQKAAENETKKKVKKKKKTEEDEQKSLEEAQRKAKAALEKSRELLRGGSPNRSPLLIKPDNSPPNRKEASEMKKKVAELQQRKKELQQQRKEEFTPPFAKKAASTSAVNDLKGIDLSSVGKSETPAVPIYESLEDIQARKVSVQEPVQKPTLPPKPTFLKHSLGALNKSVGKPPLPPKPRPLDETSTPHETIVPKIPPPEPITPKPRPPDPITPKPCPPDPITPKPRPQNPFAPKPQPPADTTEAEGYIYEIPKIDEPFKTPIAPPTQQITKEPLYELPPAEKNDNVPPPLETLGPKPTPSPTSHNTTVPEPLYHLPPPLEDPEPKSTSNFEPLYDLPPPSDTPQEISANLEPLYDLPPPLEDSQEIYLTEDQSFYGNISYNPEVVPTSPIPAISYRARFSFSATCEEEVSFTQGDRVHGCQESQSAQDGWVRIRHNDKEGWAPIDYLQPITASSSISDLCMSAEVLYSWEGTQPNHLSITKGEIVHVKQKGEGWWMGEKDGKVGWFPGKYVNEIVNDDTVESLLPLSDQYKAIYTFEGQHDGDLPFMEGDIIIVLKKDGEWWLGEANGKKGLFPSTYVSPVPQTSSLDVPTETTPSGTRKRQLVGRVIVGFIAEQEGQLSLTPGQLVLVRRQEPNGWWEGQLQSRGVQRKCGWFPSNRIELLTPGQSPGTSTVSSPAPSSGGLVLALYTYQSTSPDELTFHKGSVITVLSKEEGDWWKGEVNGRTGLFPSNYVQSLDTLKTSDASRWSDAVQPDIVEKLPVQQRKRQEAIFELIQTEKSYVHSLNLVKEVFFIPMENSSVLSEMERNQVIVNWEELIECNSAFSNALFIRLRTSGGIVRCIGEILQEHIPKLTPHVRWCSCQLNACTLLQSKSTDPQFKEFEQVCLKDPRTGGLPLSSFLLKPMQRVTKYPLLIGKILEYTSSDNPDYEPLLLALQESERLCSQVNEGVREQENSEKLEWLQTHVNVTLNEKLVFNSQTNFMGSRRLLHWGKLIKVRGNKEMIGFLFNDFFLLARPKALFVTAAQMEPFTENHFTMFREPFLLDQIQAKKGPVEQYGQSVFIINTKNDKKEMPLKADTDVARDQWIKELMGGCLKYVQKQKQQAKLKRHDSRRMTLQESARGKLLVTVIEAADLIASSDGKSDPFCVVKIGENQESATPTIQDNLNPQWNYAMPEFLISDPDNTMIEVTVFDSDLFSPNDFLGCGKVSLKELREEFGGNGPWIKRFLLEDVPKGELELRITYKSMRPQHHLK